MATAQIEREGTRERNYGPWPEKREFCSGSWRDIEPFDPRSKMQAVHSEKKRASLEREREVKVAALLRSLREEEEMVAEGDGRG
ncbi:hypothetical protein MA16_Dca014986 [Dendrobium catenatum]|uniref:Uncharacterized protein n=1 Tax=Dendrobium catenatum TaxID=906689 RepID=A0A2I0VDQ7_9ASPA|nr:hypothetical protein MA16_Dca014986 [Dendrobium catenatum]